MLIHSKILPNMGAIMYPTNNWVNNRFIVQRWVKLKYPTITQRHHTLMLGKLGKRISRIFGSIYFIYFQ